MVTIVPGPARPASNPQPVTVGLLVPIPAAAEAHPIPRAAWPWLRNRLRRRIDTWRWRAGMDMQFHTSDWVDHHNTNRGDIAIRVAIRELLQARADVDIAFVELGWDDIARWDDSALTAPGTIDRQFDLLVIGGGGYYFLDAKGGLSPRIARDLAWLRQVHCPVVALSPGVNRLLGPDPHDTAIAPAAAATLGAFLDCLALSSERSESGRDLLNTIRPGKTVTIADPALFLRPAGAASPQAGDSGPWRIGLNLAFHGPASSRHMLQRLQVLAAAAHQLSAASACEFYYFVHYEAERLIPRLLSGLGIPVRIVDTDAARMLPAYSALHVHICQMLHSSILSLNAGVPTVNLSYDVKNRAFFDLMQLGRYCLPADATDAAALTLAVQKALADSPAIRAHIAARKAALRSDLDAYLAQAMQLALGRARRRQAAGPALPASSVLQHVS